MYGMWLAWLGFSGQAGHMRHLIAVVLALGLFWALAPVASADPAPRCFDLRPMCYGHAGAAAVCVCGFSADSCRWVCSAP